MPLKNVKLGIEVVIHNPDLVNLYGCEIGDRSKIGAFVEIQKNVIVGKDCKISSHSFLCEGAKIGNGVFIGHGVMFINDLHPRATNPDGSLQNEEDWEVAHSEIQDGASIGTGALIMGNVIVGRNAMIGAGAVVTKNVSPNKIVAGVPARVIRNLPSKIDS
ncbi:MAG: N-acetyltransferase [Flavobacteriaceae bacterium]|nr:N-acetyltransferase [Flavobacteriaceae bacterium]|tara:strand:+ start:119 stop:601 length:483 start_codon:yes stop_codon:yes gene_type:complete